MKPEAEIRSHIESLRTCQQIPCGCKGTAHAHECIAGGKMMKAVEMSLLWALGENPAHEEMVADLRRAADDYKTSLN
jgi:hypothetical protein